MAIGAQPTDIIRILKRKKALGQTVEPYEYREALRSYWDVQAARRQGDRRLDLESRGMDLAEDRAENEQDAAKVSGIMEMGSTAAIGAMTLKGTSIGSKIGLGPARTSVGAPATTSVSAGGGAAKGSTIAASGGAATNTAAAAESGAGFVPGIASEAATTGVVAETAPALSLSTAAPPAAVGAIGGMAGGKIVGALGGGKNARVAGSAAGGAGAGALVGAQAGAIGGPYGAVIGGVVGGISGVIKES